MDSVRPESTVVQRLAEAALGAGITVETVDEGISTYVYRLIRGNETLYLRILPEEEATFAPEVAAHTILRRQGVRVPDVVYWADQDNLVKHSVMITTAITGAPIGRGAPGAEVRDILRAAGRDLAIMNRVPVDGFGWVRRDAPGDPRLRADLSTERDFMLADLDHSLHSLADVVVGTRECERIWHVINDHAPLLDAAQAGLAHGDFDATHIFCDAGRYTGIIDLGEIRGTGPYYDLGHFRFHDGETLPRTVAPYVLEGYQEIKPLPPDVEHCIALASLLIGIRFLARTCARLAEHNRLHAIAAIRRDLKALSS